MSAAPRPDASQIASALNRRIASLCAELLPAGRAKGGYWTVGSIDNEPGGSLYVHLSGPKQGRWTDSATGEFGDALDLLAACRCRGDKREAYRRGLDWLGHTGSLPAVPYTPVPQRAGGEADAAHATDVDRRRAYAMRVYLEAQASIAGTPAADYLAGRGIDLAELGRQPRALRCHPGLRHRPSGCTFPAMIAAVSGPDGVHIATHRTWLERIAGAGWIKARIEDPKMTIGDYPGGSIRLWRGASGKSLKDAPADQPVIIGEGIETCLSIALACPEFRVISAISLGNFGGVWLPPQVRMVVLAADNDIKPAARLHLQRAAERHLAAGRHVRIARSPFGNDFNDALRG
jgi:hypothetical protein